MTDTAILAEILRELRDLRADFDVLVSRGRLTRDERALLGELLPIVAGIVGDAAFVVADLLELPALRRLLAGHTARSISLLLSRAHGAGHGGFRVVRAGRDRDGGLWRVRRVLAAQAR